MKRLLVVSIAFFLLLSCTKGGGQKGDYVAKVGDTTITTVDVQKEMESLPPMAKDFFQGPEGISRFVDELVKKELLYLEAKKRGLDKSEDFQRKVDDFKKFTLINQLLEKEIESASKVTDKEIKDYYDAHKGDFMVNNEVRISHILVKTEEDARRVLERLQKGEDFAKIASEVSLDKASSKTGGDLGYFKKGQMNPELENVAFRLKKGQISQPIPLKGGFDIIKVTDTKGTIAEFDKVKGIVSQKLSAEKQREAFDKFIENLRKSYKIELNKEAIAKLTLPPPKQEKQGK
ncbi:MAG: peptidylprolyl isomerase [Dissulfurispiraceae bacterium]